MSYKFLRSQLSTFWSRVFAFIFDILIVSVVFGALSLIFTAQKGSMVPIFGFSLDLRTIDWLGFVLVWVYNIFMVKIFGATIGKMALGLRVTDLEGKQADWMTIIVREVVGKMLSAIILGIGYLMVIWDDNRQGLHDKIAETLVVRESALKDDN